MGIFETLKKTAANLSAAIGSKADKVAKDALETALIESDMNYDLVSEVLESLPAFVGKEQLEKALLGLFDANAEFVESAPDLREVWLIIGINGAGKTTTIARLARRWQSAGASLLLGAGDTFRAAAIEQLKGWGERLGLPVVATKLNGDPSSVAFDSIASGAARGAHKIIIDTAGRLHNKDNLMKELEKILRVSAKAIEQARLERGVDYALKTLLVLDGTQGSSAINQARIFNECAKLDGVVVTKLDGTSRGGAAFSIQRDLKIPIAYIGTGESATDLALFSKTEFVAAFLEGIF